MKSSSWRETAELIGIGAIVASLVFVGFQLRQESDIAAREGSSAFVATSVELARLFSDNEEVWRKGLKDDPLTESEQVTYNALVRVFFIERFNRFRRRQLSVGSGADVMEVPKFVALYMYQYPGLRRAMNALDTKNQIMRDVSGVDDSSQFLLLVRDFLKQYDEDKPTLPPPDFIVF
jgi:hypothetical protein